MNVCLHVCKSVHVSAPVCMGEQGESRQWTPKALSVFSLWKQMATLKKKQNESSKPPCPIPVTLM